MPALRGAATGLEDAEDFEEGATARPDDDGGGPSDVFVAHLQRDAKGDAAQQGNEDHFQDDPTNGPSGRLGRRLRVGLGL